MKKGILNLTNFLFKYNIPLCLLGLYALLTHTFGIQNCILKLLIGYPCPGCGMTRAVISLVQFDFIAAFHYNPFVYAIPWIGLVIFFKDQPIIKKILNTFWFSIFLIAIVLVVYILRLIYVYPNCPMDYNAHNVLSFILSLFQ